MARNEANSANRSIATSSAESNCIGKKTLRRIALVVALTLGAYLVGFIPSWLMAKGYEHERDELQAQLRAANLRRSLASAAMLADRGQFNEALNAASQMFDHLRADLNRREEGLTGIEPDAKTLLAERDDLVASLARQDPSAADRLSNWYFELEGLGGKTDQTNRHDRDTKTHGRY